jgi:hypothetical protein
MRRSSGLALTLVCCTACIDLDPNVGASPLVREEPDSGDAGTISFARDIRPLINRTSSPTAKGCVPCHDPSAPKHVGLDLGGVDVSTLGKLREGGGTSGRRIIVPYEPDASALVQKLRGTYAYGTRMPKSGPPFWTDEEIRLVVDWIAQGARGADDE